MQSSKKECEVTECGTAIIIICLSILPLGCCSRGHRQPDFVPPFGAEPGSTRGTAKVGAGSTTRATAIAMCVATDVRARCASARRGGCVCVMTTVGYVCALMMRLE